MSRETAVPARPHVHREDVNTKARRILGEGRLTIVRVHLGQVQAVCHGDNDTYRLGRDPSGRWWCTCACFGARCSHLAALRLVTVATIRKEAAA